MILNPYSYNVSFDENIGSVGRDIMKYLKETNKLQVSHSWKGIDYRFAFGTSGNDCLGYLNNNMDSVSWDMFFTKIVLALDGVTSNQPNLMTMGMILKYFIVKHITQIKLLL